MYQIQLKKLLNSNTYFFRIHCPYIAIHAKAGQFVVVRQDELSERIPLTICDVGEDWIEIIFQTLGFSTRQLAILNEKDYLVDVVGPLGKAIKVYHNKRVLAVAGGVGAAPIYPQIKLLKSLGNSIDLVLGGRSKENILLIEKFEHLCDSISICTDDGSMGTKGFVTQILPEILLKNKYDEAIVIGPGIMMYHVFKLLEPTKIPTSVSLNPIMIDGTGMCGECRVNVHGKTLFACVDGPDFDAYGVDFHTLMSRNNNFVAKEQHICKVREKHGI